MTEVTLAPRCKARIYEFALPVHFPFFGIGMTIARFKQLGVWDKLPDALRRKTERARAGWSGLSLTQTDLDSIPDDVWKTIASAFGVGWRYVR